MGSSVEDKVSGAGAGLGWLGSIMELKRRYGFFNILQGLLLLFLTFVVLVLWFHPEVAVNVYKDYATKAHSEAVDRRLIADSEIRLVLRDVLSYFQADRVYLIELHNGTENLSSGLPFIRGDMRLEEVRDTVAHIDTEFKDFSLSMYPFVGHLFTTGLFVGSTDDVKYLDSRLYYKLRVDDTEHIAWVALYYGRRPMGVLGVSWCGAPVDRGVDIDSSLYVLRGYSTQVATILSDL